ncbi:glycosyltransferase family 4 protein [Shimia sediminis]|uniref:glycosyltransferase family 4 protein n=1 Tax=Shimia sediminis TaxID=2497945 RepID=UPI000F8E6E22|nr:glycosyltransferase family 4 protein [Shimia sediminis]
MRKIAFFSLTPSPPAPPANQKTLEALKAAYPDSQIDEFYILPLLKNAPLAMLTAAGVAGVTYAPDLLRGHKKFKYAAFRTPWVFDWIKQQAGKLIDPEQYAFTFQMQSLFDASVKGVPHFIYTDHTHLENLNFEDFDPSALYSKGWIDCEKTIYQNATTVFTRSSNVSASLEDQYQCGADKIRCVYAGSNAAAPTTPMPTPDRYSQKNILFAGVDWIRKGGPTLLAAFQKILPRHPDASLTIVGCSPDIGQTPQCKVVGRVPLEEMPKWYEEASVFCLPTRVEPFGIVFVEAMWQSLPILATRVGAVPDMVIDSLNGFLIQPGDVDALANRLDTILNDQTMRADMGNAGRQLAEDRYDWSAVANRMRKHIHEQLNTCDAQSS